MTEEKQPGEPEMMPFEDWIARVESEVASGVDAESYRDYWERGLTPAEAVADDRASGLSL